MAYQIDSDDIQLNSHNSLRRTYFSSVSQREFSDVLNGKNFSIQATSYPNAATKERFPSKDRQLTQSGKCFKTPVKVPLISEDDFVALSLQALQGISSFLYNSDTIRLKQLHICNFILLGRSATSLSKYQLAFSESYYIRLLVGSAQEAYSTLSSDRKFLSYSKITFTHTLLVTSPRFSTSDNSTPGGQLAFGAALGKNSLSDTEFRSLSDL